MKISENSWHYRLFVFMSQWNAAWRNRDDYLDHPKTSRREKFNIGLCPYMRMILIWGPLSILSNLIPLLAVLGALVAMPTGMNGLAGVLWLLFWAVSAVAIGFAIAKLADWRQARAENQEKLQVYRQSPDYVKKDTFLSLLGEFLMSIKTKICPVLEVEK
jgi:hypothetical protein